MKIVVATKNINKAAEIKEVLKGTDYEIYTMKEAGIDVDIEETGSTFEENALIKARFISKLSEEISMADDSGLEVDHLGKKPGIFSSRFGGAETSYRIKNSMILEQLEGVPFEKRTARFVCAMAVVFKDGEEVVINRTIEGFIGYEEKGDNGFGYDPIFYVPEYDMTTAEMDIKLKNKISHRGKALTDIAEILREREQKQE